MDSLYDRYGGKPFWELVLDSFYYKNLRDPVIGFQFDGKSIDRIKLMYRGILSIALRSPSDNFPISTRHAHRNMHIPDQHFDIFISNLEQVLLESGVVEDDCALIVALLQACKPDVLSKGQRK